MEKFEDPFEKWKIYENSKKISDIFSESDYNSYLDIRVELLEIFEEQISKFKLINIEFQLDAESRTPKSYTIVITITKYPGFHVQIGWNESKFEVEYCISHEYGGIVANRESYDLSLKNHQSGYWSKKDAYMLSSQIFNWFYKCVKSQEESDAYNKRLEGFYDDDENNDEDYFYEEE